MTSRKGAEVGGPAPSERSAGRRGDRTGVDLVVAVAGASRGFTVLLLGGVVQPWVAHLFAPLGYVWLLIVALVAFVVAAIGWRGEVVTNVASATAAAVGSYLLVAPLVFAVARELPLTQALGTLATAVVVGALSGYLRSARRPTTP